MNKKEDLNIPVMILCIIGTVFTIFGILVLKTDNFKLKVISTSGTVTGVTEARTSEGIVEQRTVNLSYIANNTNYNATINNYENQIQVGDRMTLYYDLFSAQNVDKKRSGYIGYLAVIAGIAIVVKTGPKFVKIIKDNYL